MEQSAAERAVSVAVPMRSSRKRCCKECARLRKHRMARILLLLYSPTALCVIVRKRMLDRLCVHVLLLYLRLHTEHHVRVSVSPLLLSLSVSLLPLKTYSPLPRCTSVLCTPSHRKVVCCVVLGTQILSHGLRC